jgi:hypothetical protein
MTKTTEENIEWKKTEQYYKDWENSLEGIHYKVITMAATNMNDDKDKMLIAETLQKLPAKVRNKVLEGLYLFL